MAEHSKIEWTDHTWNPWIGCTKVSPACDNCYAEALMADRLHQVEWGSGNDRKTTSEANWKQPLRWNRAAAARGVVENVFCLSLGDIWDNEVDPHLRAKAFNVMDSTPQLRYLLLSKRIGNAVKMCNSIAGLPRNAALGATLVNQDEWDRDLPKLQDAGQRLGALFTFASVEPMLGPINANGSFPDWVIVGGESGPSARPMHPDWVRALRDQCAEADVAFFFKQWGAWLPSPDHMNFTEGEKWAREIGAKRLEQHSDGHTYAFVGKKRAGRLLDGVTHNAMPEVQ